MAEKKANPDYTASAKDLKNPTEVQEAYKVFMSCRQASLKAEAAIESMVPEHLRKDMVTANEAEAVAHAALKEAVQKFGGYQDIEGGHYALIQINKSPVYDVNKFLEHFPNYAPAVVMQTVDDTKMKGLLKGGLIKPEELEAKGVVTYKTVEKFIVK